MDTLNRILDLLKAKGKSQKELAEILGLCAVGVQSRLSDTVEYVLCKIEFNSPAPAKCCVEKFNIFKLFRPGDITVLLAVPIPTDLVCFFQSPDRITLIFHFVPSVHSSSYLFNFSISCLKMQYVTPRKLP